MRTLNKCHNMYYVMSTNLNQETLQGLTLLMQSEVRSFNYGKMMTTVLKEGRLHCLENQKSLKKINLTKGIFKKSSSKKL